MARLGARVLAVGLGLLLLELFLQGAAWVRGDGARSSGAGGGAAVLCLGDSHTFGLNVSAEHTWPAVLEGWMQRTDPGARAINRGQIGKHTGHVLAELAADLGRYQPRVVLVLAGVNNAWSRGAMAGEEGGEPWYFGSRVVKLSLILAQRFGWSDPAGASGTGATAPRLLGPEEQPDPPLRPGEARRVELGDGRARVLTLDRDGRAVEFAIGGGVLEEGEESLAEAWVRGDLVRIAKRAREGGAEPVFLTYAIEEGPVLPVVNRAIRRAAAQSGALLVDQAALARPWIAEFGRERLFFHDAHPRREGYQLLGTEIYRALWAAGILEGPEPPDPAEALRNRAAPAPQMALVEGAEGSYLELSYEPGLEFTVWLSRSAERGFHLGGVPIALDRDELFEAAMQWPELSGAFDGAGRARVPVDPSRWRAAPGESPQPTLALLLVRTPDWSVVALGAPLALE